MLTGRVRRRARAPRGEPDRVVGHRRARASTSNASCAARDADRRGRDDAARPRRRARTRRGRPTGYDVVAVLAGDGTLNEAGGGLAGSDGRARAAPRRLDQRVRPHARDRVRARRRGPSSWSTRSRAARRGGSGSAPRPRRAREPRHFLFHLGVGFDAAIIRRMEQRAVGQALPRAPGVRGGHASTPGSATTTAAGDPPRDRRRRRRRRRDRRRALRGDLQLGSVHLRRPPADAIAPDAVARRRARGHRAAPTLRAPLLVRAGGVEHRHGPPTSTTSPEIVQVADVVGGRARAPTSPFPWQVDGDYLGDVDHLRRLPARLPHHRHRPERLAGRDRARR